MYQMLFAKIEQCTQNNDLFNINNKQFFKQLTFTLLIENLNFPSYLIKHLLVEIY